jgi:hypothetical protein
MSNGPAAAAASAAAEPNTHAGIKRKADDVKVHDAVSQDENDVPDKVTVGNALRQALATFETTVMWSESHDKILSLLIDDPMHDQGRTAATMRAHLIPPSPAAVIRTDSKPSSGDIYWSVIWPDTQHPYADWLLLFRILLALGDDLLGMVGRASKMPHVMCALLDALRATEGIVYHANHEFVLHEQLLCVYEVVQDQVARGRHRVNADTYRRMAALCTSAEHVRAAWALTARVQHEYRCVPRQGVPPRRDTCNLADSLTVLLSPQFAPDDGSGVVPCDLAHAKPLVGNLLVPASEGPTYTMRDILATARDRLELEITELNDDDANVAEPLRESRGSLLKSRGLCLAQFVKLVALCDETTMRIDTFRVKRVQIVAAVLSATTFSVAPLLALVESYLASPRLYVHRKE